MKHFIKSERIYLRSIEINDANDEYLSWLNDQEITRGLASGAFPVSQYELKSFLEKITANRNAIMLAICDNSNDRHIGNIKLDNFDWISRTCELGLLIGDKNYWGKGYGYEVCKLLLVYAFTTLCFRKVLLAVYQNNPAAIALYTKLGFVVEGQLRKHIFDNGQYYDKFFMGIFAEELV